MIGLLICDIEKYRKIKIKEVINLIDPIVENKKFRDDHMVALLQYVELSQEIELV